MRAWENIIIHCSDSNFGDKSLIDEWHRERGWDSCGYSYVILNGVRRSKHSYIEEDDGYIETGRGLDTIGSHCKGWNHNSLGICLIGTNQFSEAQRTSLKILIDDLMAKCPTITQVLGHYQTDSGAAQGKTCPNFDIDDYKFNYDIKG